MAAVVATPIAAAQLPAAKQRPSAEAEAQAPAVQPAPARTDSVLEARTSKLAAQLRCPVCQGLSIQDSPSELSQQMRALVRDQLAAGKSDEEVKAYFISKYGEWILLAPKPTGFNALVYLMPAFALIVGAGIVTLVVRKWTANNPEITS
jgi:cytochrome c-type biogenesis protein CcmH